MRITASHAVLSPVRYLDPSANSLITIWCFAWTVETLQALLQGGLMIPSPPTPDQWFFAEMSMTIERFPVYFKQVNPTHLGSVGFNSPGRSLLTPPGTSFIWLPGWSVLPCQAEPPAGCNLSPKGNSLMSIADH